MSGSRRNKKRKRADRQNQTKRKTIKEEARSTIGKTAEPSTSNVQRPWWKRAPPLVLILFTSAASLVTFYASCPRVSIEPTPALKTSDPYSARFVVTNTGLFTIHDVAAFCGHPFKITHDAGATWQDQIGWDRATEAVIGDLPSDQSVTATCPAPPIRIGFSDGTVVPPAPPEGFIVKVAFRPDYWLTPKTKSARFGVAFGEDGHPYWFKKPLPQNRSIPQPPSR